MKPILVLLTASLVSFSAIADVQPGKYSGKIAGLNKACDLEIQSVARPKVVDYQGRMGKVVSQKIEFSTSLDPRNLTSTVELSCVDSGCTSLRADVRTGTANFENVQIFFTSDPSDLYQEKSSKSSIVSKMPNYVPYQVRTSSTVCNLNL